MSFLDDSETKTKKRALTPLDISKKYSILLSFLSNGDLKLDIVSNSKKGSRFFIRDDYKFFSKSQKVVLKDVKEISSWGQNINIDSFFQNLKKSKFNIYYKKDKEIKKIDFSDNQSNKISLEFFKASKNNFFPLFEGDFVLRISDQKSFQEIAQNILFGEKAVFYIQENNLFKLNLEKDILNIFKRIVAKNYDKISGSFSERFETSLYEDEIFKINKIIDKLKNDFNLKTEIKAKFKIKKFKKREKKIEVFYNSKEAVLEIKPIIDYEFVKIDISQTVLKKVSKGEVFFTRRANSFWGYKNIIRISNYEIFYTPVDFEKEISFFKELYSFSSDLGFTKNLKLVRKSHRQINSFVTKNWGNFKKRKYDLVFLKDKIDAKVVEFKAEFEVDFEPQKNNAENNISFGANFFLGEDKISFDDLSKYFSTKNKDFLDGNGNRIEVKNKEELEKILDLIKNFRQLEKTNKFKGKLYNAFELKNIFTSSRHYSANFNSGFQKFINEAQNGKIVKKIDISPEYEKILRPYQKEGINWMHFLKKYYFGGVLADDMGLGKTIQTLLMLEKNRVKGKPSIVIVPKTLLSNWEDEIKKFAKKTEYILVDGSVTERQEIIKSLTNFDLVVTSYSFFQKDFLEYQQNKIIFNYAILDEAQYIKNFKTKNAQFVKQINANYRLTLTGTPLENSVSEIWSIFEFLMPGFLGKYSEFSKKYINPIKNGNKKALEKLSKKISPFMLRRTKDSVLKELPQKTINILKPELSDQQKALYAEVLSQVKKDLFEDKTGEIKRSYMHILAALTRLRQVCNHPALLTNPEKYREYSSSKLDLFLNLVREIKTEGRKVLVFSQFRTMLEILEKELNREGIENISLTGKSKNRGEIIKKFNQNKDITVFLISLKAGGVGLNLTAADNVILFDPWWNPSAEKQAIDRTHRIGQEKKVNVYKLITKDTIEEKILLLQNKKQSLFDSLINESDNSLKNLSWDDLKDIFD